MAVKLDNTKFVRNLTKGYKLASHIDKVIGDGEFTWSAEFAAKHGDDAFHPSGDCVPTPFALYTKATTGEYKKPGTSLYKSFAVGHFWHAYLQYILVEKLAFADWNCIERCYEDRWAEGAYGWARGSADIAPCVIPGYGEYLVDIKTMGAFDFKQPNVPGWCAAKYECQINIYMDWFDMEKCILLCVQKDSPHELKEFEYVRNQPLIDTIHAKWKLVKECFDQGVEPPENYEPQLPLVGARL